MADLTIRDQQLLSDMLVLGQRALFKQYDRKGKLKRDPWRPSEIAITKVDAIEAMRKASEKLDLGLKFKGDDDAAQEKG